MRPLYPRPVCSRCLLATTIAFALSSAVTAQEVAPDTENEHNYIEEITVTAQMRDCHSQIAAGFPTLRNSRGNLVQLSVRVARVRHEA